MNLLQSHPEAAYRVGTLLVRLMVGVVFLSEGVQKFLYPELSGPGRFAQMGFPNPEFWGYFVGAFETLCGALVLVGLLTRLAAIPTLCIMLVAIVTTKIPVLLGHDLGPFVVRKLPVYGFLSMLHEMRTDWAMLLGSLFLVLAGGRPYSLDAWFLRHRQMVSKGHATQ